MFRHSHQTHLYTDRTVRLFDVYKRVCLEGTCVQNWDGAEDSVFGLSAVTAAGYEIGINRY